MNKKTLYLLLFIAIYAFSAKAQTVSGFENSSVPPSSFLNDAGPAGFFFSGHAALPNYYDASFDYWEGWAISNVTDNLNPGFTNQYSAIAGSGALQSSNYAVSYAFNPTSIFLNGPAKGGTVSGMYITNDTYTYFSMKDGDPFSKKFGGESGNDPDFFKLTLHGYNNGAANPDSIEVYLADYRFENNTQDYIINAWTYMDLKPLGNVEEITFSLSSTDNGQFGMNTPAYFCVDHLITDDNTTGVQQPAEKTILQLSPNPANRFTRLEWTGADTEMGKIYDSSGRLQQTISISNGINSIDIQLLPAGVYYLRVKENAIRFTVCN
jgi:hypothetical protein